MDLFTLEKAAMVVFEMCRQHPEICPHDYEWRCTKTNEDGKCVEYYKCNLCGDERTKIL